MAPTPVLPGEFHGQRSLMGCSPWGCRESDTIEHTQSPAKLQVHGIFKCSLDELCDTLEAEGGEG